MVLIIGKNKLQAGCKLYTFLRLTALPSSLRMATDRPMPIGAKWRPTHTNRCCEAEVRDLQGPSVFVSDPHFAYGVTNIQSWNVDEWTLVTVHGGTTDQNIGYDVANVSPWGTAHRGA